MFKMFEYFGAHSSQIWKLTLEHIEMTAIAVCIAVLIGVPLGILISYVRKLDKPVLGLANVVQAIPSMALLGLAIPLLGIGVLPAIVMVIIYSLLPIVKNTYTGISGIDPLMVEAADAETGPYQSENPDGTAGDYGRRADFGGDCSGPHDHGGIYRSRRLGVSCFCGNPNHQ